MLSTIPKNSKGHAPCSIVLFEIVSHKAKKASTPYGVEALLLYQET